MKIIILYVTLGGGAERVFICCQMKGQHKHQAPAMMGAFGERRKGSTPGG